MLLATGINFGVRRAWPHILGVAIGFPLMIACIGFGLGQIFEIYPWIYVVLKYAGAAYMVWLAWKIAMSTPSTDDGIATGEPVTFLQASAFQWVNPKAWTMALGAISAYTVAADYTKSLLVVGAVFVVVNFPTVSLWTMFGVGLLVFGTPTLLLAGYDFDRALSLLLPASLCVSAAQLLHPAAREKVNWHYVGWSVPFMAMALAQGYRGKDFVALLDMFKKMGEGRGG